MNVLGSTEFYKPNVGFRTDSNLPLPNDGNTKVLGGGSRAVRRC
jgi:hypothetical protein